MFERASWLVATYGRRSIISALKTLGYELNREGSNHAIYQLEGGPVKVIVPVPRGSAESGTGQLKRIATSLHLTLPEFEMAINGRLTREVYFAKLQAELDADNQ